MPAPGYMQKERDLSRKPILTTGDVAFAAHVACRTVSKWADTGTLKSYRIPGSQDRRFERSDVVSFFKANRMPLGPLAAGSYRVLVVGGPPGLWAAVAGELREAERERVEGLEVADGFGAGWVFRDRQPDAVIVFGRIGRAGLLRLGKRLGQCELLEGMPLLAVAGEDGGGADEARAGGYSDVTQEPVSAEQLAEWVRRAIAADPPTGGRRKSPGADDGIPLGPIDTLPGDD